jgi:hypothetical protein
MFQLDKNDPASPAELRRCAQRARDIASTLIGDPAEQRLLQLAQEYEGRAVQLEATTAQHQP